MNKLTFWLSLITIIITSAFVIGPDIVSRSISANATSDTASSTPYTLEDVSSHKDAESCWTTIEGKVYDITTYVPIHPGGEKSILKICGKDGSSMFENKHGDDAGPEKMLSTFLIGNLAE